MKMRRLLSVLLAVVMLMSVLSVGIVVTSAAEVDEADTAADIDAAYSGSAYSDMQSKVTAENKYGLSSTVNYGTILQAWNWSYANIEANLDKIAEQGFTTIQVSPPNEIKQATKGVNVTQGDTNGWWMFYQPVGFQINQSTDNALGTKSQFVSMCSKAHEKGLKVIADAVINHVGTKDAPDSDGNVMNHVNNKVQQYEPVLYNNQLFHSPWKKMQYIESNDTQYNSTYDLTRNCTSGLPDLKTEDQRVQDMIYEYLEELVEAGCDGFRFDAAKHIETPDDISSLASDFWTDTLVKVQNAHPEKEIYAYGEILNTCGINRPYSMYTKLFDVTDSASYWGIKDAVTGGGGNAIPYYPNTNFTKENVMLWDESHDTYVDGATTGLTSVQRGKIWALVAGRAEISSVYLARPDDGTSTNSLSSIKLGDVKMTSWSNATTKAINQFHNYFIGKSEYCSSSGGTAWIERGTNGVMIVNLGGTTSKSVSLKANKLAAGDYIDAITGNKFTVSGGYIKGQVGSTGVAVVYENAAEPEPTDPPETYVVGDVDENGEVDDVDVTLIMRYTVDMVQFSDKQLLAGDVDGDGYVTIIDATIVQRYAAQMTVKYPVGETKEVGDNPGPVIIPTNPYVIPTTPDETDPPVSNDSFLLTDNFGWGSAYVYAWDANGDALCGEWPGASQAETTTNEFGQTQFVCHVPDGAVGVILNNGNGAQTEDITDFTYTGYWMDGTKNDLGHYKVTGWRSEDPIIVNPTDPPVQNPTDPPVIHSSTSFLLTDNFGWGSAYVYAWDANGDALCGEWPGAAQADTQINEFGQTQFVCNVPDGAVGVILNNGNGAQTEDITDFSYDGFWMDGTQNGLGHYIVTGWRSDDPIVINPTDPPVQNPTDPPVIISNTSFLLTDNFGWGSAYVYAWDANGDALCGEWPGAAQADTQINEFGQTQFVCNVPDGAVGVILNNGNGAQTEDITDFTYTGYWMDGTKNSLGHYIVTGWRDGDDPIVINPTDPPVVNPTDPPVIISNTSFLLTDNFGWGTAYVYAWDANGDALCGEWPGAAQAQTQVNEFGQTQFVCNVPEGAAGVILNNGNGAQTEDITDFTSEERRVDGTKNSLGHYIVTGWRDGDDPVVIDPPVEDPTDPPVIISNTSFLLTDNFGWGVAYVYAWDADGNALNGQWPGASQAQTQTNEFGQTQFVCEVPDGAVGVILNNGNGAQTEDITDFSYTGYWMDGSKNSLGHYIVTGWN